MGDASERAERARQLLDDPVLAGALQGLEADALAQVLAVSTYDPHEAVSAVCNIKAVYAVRGQLASLITSGTTEERQRPAVA